VGRAEGLFTETVILDSETAASNAGGTPEHLYSRWIMVSNRRAARLAIIFFLIGFSPVVWAEEPLNVENWPGDVPCNVLKKHSDGTYEITVAWNRFFQRHAPGTKYRNTRETDYWAQKCKGQTL
jgi:hypothetical protein